MHQNGKYKPSDLYKTDEYKELIKQTANVISTSLEDNVLSNDMQKHFEDDIFLFSGLKTHAQLSEASQLLLTEDKKIKNFSQFSRDVEQIKENYNTNYLEAEYEYAVGAVQMAERWRNFSDNDRSLLQYRTAADDKVRQSHQVLHNTTLPANDPFWDLYTPPNGWRCRCTVAQVLKSKHKTTNPATAMDAGEKATTQIGKNGKNKLEIFRYNPAKKKVIFPPTHPYQKTVGAKEVKKIIKEDLKKQQQVLNEKNKNMSADVLEYEKKANIKLDRSFFRDYFNKTVPLTHTSRKRNAGAHYSPHSKTVFIPLKERWKASDWYKKSIIYHEFGHGSDWQHGMRENKLVKDLMSKYRKEFRKDKHKKFLELEAAWRKEIVPRMKKDKIEQLSAFTDTLMSLDTNYGYGHTKAYFKQKGKKEAEFIAHAFENRFVENEVFRKLAPELYEDMRKLIDQLKPKQK